MSSAHLETVRIWATKAWRWCQKETAGVACCKGLGSVPTGQNRVFQK